MTSSTHHSATTPLPGYEHRFHAHLLYVLLEKVNLSDALCLVRASQLCPFNIISFEFYYDASRCDDLGLISPKIPHSLQHSALS
ncbi:hypothetical protein Tco_1153151 [Tanacetum coccineum]